MEYRTVIGAKLNGRLCYFDLDTCTEKSLSSSATVPQYPVENGVTVADHMYRNARTLNLAGSFSLAGRNSYENSNLYTKDNIIGNLAGGEKPWEQWFEEDAGELKDLNGVNRLEAVQKVFEYIQAKGILCTVMMCSRTDTENIRFKVRDSMALTGINWREQYNSMSYTFTFTEVITVTKFGDFETFNYEELYPQTTLPATKSLGEIVSESGSLYKTVIEALIDYGYIALADGKAYVLKGVKDNAFWEIFSEIIPAWVGIGAAAIGGVAVGVATTSLVSTAAAVTGTSAAAGPIGLAVGLIVAGVILAAGLIYNTYQERKIEKRLEQGFNLIQNYKTYVDPKTFEPTGVSLNSAMVNRTDIARLRMLLEDVQYEIDTQLRNVQFYSMPDSPGDVPVTVGVDALTLRINSTGNASQPFSMQILRGYGDGAVPVAPYFGSWCVESSLYNMDENQNAMYKDTSRQYWMFLYNPYMESETAKAAGYNSPEDAMSVLSNYYVVTVRGSIKDAMDKVSKTVTKALGNQGYTE
jgi:hypothetical protein